MIFYGLLEASGALIAFPRLASLVDILKREKENRQARLTWKFDTEFEFLFKYRLRVIEQFLKQRLFLFIYTLFLPYHNNPILLSHN